MLRKLFHEQNLQGHKNHGKQNHHLKKELLLQKKLDLLHANERTHEKKKTMKLFQNLEKNSAGESIQHAQNAVLVKIKNENITRKNEQNR